MFLILFSSASRSKDLLTLTTLVCVSTMRTWAYCCKYVQLSCSFASDFMHQSYHSLGTNTTNGYGTKLRERHVRNSTRETSSTVWCVPSIRGAVMLMNVINACQSQTSEALSSKICKLTLTIIARGFFGKKWTTHSIFRKLPGPSILSLLILKNAGLTSCSIRIITSSKGNTSHIIRGSSNWFPHELYSYSATWRATGFLLSIAGYSVHGSSYYR